MATSRETGRDALVALLATALVGAGLPVKTVAGSKQTALEGITPLVVVLGSSTKRVALTYQGNRATFNYVIQTWVLQSGTGWTTAEAEDALDDIERRIAEVCETNTNTATWEVLEYSAPTRITEVVDAGTPYYVETIPVSAMLAKN